GRSMSAIMRALCTHRKAPSEVASRFLAQCLVTSDVALPLFARTWFAHLLVQFAPSSFRTAPDTTLESIRRRPLRFETAGVRAFGHVWNGPIGIRLFQIHSKARQT